MKTSRATFLRILTMSACTSTTLAVLAFAAFPVSLASAEGIVPVGPLVAGVPGQTGFGTITGRLVWGGESAPLLKPQFEKGKSAKDPNVCAVESAIPAEDLVVDPSSKGVKSGIAYLMKPAGANPSAVKALVEKKPKVVVDQKNCQFAPHVVLLHKDQLLEVKSSDPIGHNVHLTSFNVNFNQMLAPGGAIEKKIDAEKRPIRLTCDIHPWMSGWIGVFDHPFFAVTGDDGSFEITGVPAGEQKLVVWQETVGYATPGLAAGMSVNVQAGKTSDVGAIKLDPSKVKIEPGRYEKK